MENLAGFVLVEDAPARQVLHRCGPFWRGLEIVQRATGGNVFRPERDVEVVVEVTAKRGHPEECPAHALAHHFDLLDGRAGDRGVTDIVVFEVGQNARDVIDFERTADTLMLGARRHHEMFDVKLTAALEQIRQRHLSLQTGEDVVLLDANPGQSKALGRDLVALTGPGLLAFQKRDPYFEPFLPRNDLMLHGRLRMCLAVS
jgi:hypothetical protein